MFFGATLGALAEGSKELCANGGDRPWLMYRTDTSDGSPITNLTIIWAYAKAGEIINLGSSVRTTGKIIWYAPDGTSGTNNTAGGVGIISNRTQEVAGPLPNANGYVPRTLTVGAGQAGAWEIHFVSPNPGSGINPTAVGATANWTQPTTDGQVAAWDVTVRSSGGAAIPGRVYANLISMNMGEWANGGTLRSQVYYLTADGYQYRINLNSLDPYRFQFFANNRGFRDGTGAPLFKSVELAGSSVHNPLSPDTATDITHKLFFNTPAGDLPASAATHTGTTWLRATPATVVTSNIKFVGVDGTTNQVGSALGGYFTFDATGNGSYIINIDLNGDGVYTSAVDRVLLGPATAGANSVFWDGRDGQGNPAPGGQSLYNSKVAVANGEVHFPFADAEGCYTGLVIERLNGPTNDTYQIYWDDTGLSGGTKALPPTGSNSVAGAHAWLPSGGSGFGNARGIDTWVFVPGDYEQLDNPIVIKQTDLETVSQTRNPALVTPGAEVTFAVVIRNNGPDNTPQARFLNIFPPGFTNLTFLSANFSGTAGISSAVFSNGSYDARVRMNVGETGTITLRGTATTLGVLTNTAQFLTYDDVGDVDDPGRTGAGNNSKSTTVTVNDLPVAAADGYTVSEDAALNVNAASGVLANDSDSYGSPLIAVQVAGPAHGTLTLNSDGSFAYTPAPNYSGADSFTYKANDGLADSGIATVSLTVTAVNDPPVAAADNYTTAEDSALNVSAPGVLANDTDADGDPLTAVLVAGPAHGSLTLNPDGSFSYTPAANYNGPDSFTYRANDGTANSGTVTVSLTVEVRNDPPVAGDFATTVDEDTVLSEPAPGVLSPATDPDGDPLTAVLVAGPAHGTFTLHPDGSFDYTPNPNYNGTDTFTFLVNDGTNDSNVATATITVNAVADAPVAQADTYAAVPNTTLDVPASGVLTNDTDADGDTLTAVLVTGPAHGSLTLNPDGSFSYTPATGYSGPDSFTYQATDGDLDSDPVTVTIAVGGLNTAPVANDDTITVAEDDDVTGNVLANDEDAQGDPLAAVLVTGPAHGTLTFSADGVFTYVPADNYNGPDSFTYYATDGLLASGTATVTVTVTPVDGAGDVDLYARKIGFKLDRAKANRDRFKIGGKINPRGAKDDLAGATLQFSLNGTNLFTPVVLDSRGVGALTAGPAKLRCRVSARTGKYLCSAKGIDLAAIIGAATLSPTGKTVLAIRLTTTGTSLDIPALGGLFETPYRTAAAKSTGKFVYRKNRTLTGVFNWNKTRAIQLKNGTAGLKAKGVIETEGGSSVKPTGDVRVTVGGASFLLPKTGVRYSLVSKTLSFRIKAANLTDTGLPPAGNGAVMAYRLPVLIEVPVAGGTNTFETILELKRKTPTTTKWSR